MQPGGLTVYIVEDDASVRDSLALMLGLAGYRTAWVKIVVAPDAREDVVDVDTELAEIEE